MEWISKSTSLPPTSAGCAGVQLDAPVAAVVQLSTGPKPLVLLEDRSVTTAAVPEVLYVSMDAMAHFGGMSAYTVTPSALFTAVLFTP